MRPLLAAALLALGAPARAAVDAYDAGLDPGKGIIWSDDGYHYAWYEPAEGEDRWIVDGKVRVKGAEGSLEGPAALSPDGRLLLHALAVPGGVAAAVNGKRIGGAYEELAEPRFSPRGVNAAYGGKTAKGWSYVSVQGAGPAFKEPPLHAAVTDKRTQYVVDYNGTRWLYVDHKPVRKLPPFAGVSASADLARLAGVFEGSDGMVYVEVDGERFGPYNQASTPVFSRSGKHFAFMASAESQSGYDVLVVDGQDRPMKRCGDCSVQVDDAGRAFQDQIMTGVSERAQIHVAFLDGKSLHAGGQPPRVGLAPGGRHYVYPMSSSRGLVVGLDGAIAETGVPMPLVPAPVVFDGEEYHYWAAARKRLFLVCGHAVAKAPRTRCAGVARAAGWPKADVVAEP
ncbi:MAG: hypothetical protein M0D55_05510 [Elusimicrobiota bacterium]|nr:MAG: hypothetical protein M0D55_05510 [Elusimicrobiota bacterium]